MSVLGPLHIFKAPVIWHSAHSFWISTIDFLIALAYYIIDGNSTSNLTIQGYTPNTNSIGTNPSGLVVLLIALNAIYSTISLSISGILIVII